MTGVAGVHRLVYLITICVMMTSLPRADSQTIATEVEMTVISEYTNQKYNASFQDQSSLAYKTVNSTACEDISDAIKMKSAGKISACSTSMAEQAGNGTKCTINVTVLPDGKTTDERFALIKSAIVQAANASSTWVVADITNNSPIPMTIRLISKRTDLTYIDDYKDPLGYSYSVGNSTMCDDVINALATAAIVRSCEVEHYEAADPGLKAYLKMNLTAKGPEEKQVFMSIGNTIVSAAKDKSRWDVLLKDITLIPAKKPQIDTKSSFKMKIFSTRVDINGTNIPTDTNDEFFKTAKDKMCEDFNDALYTTAVIESCEADNFTSASPGVKATITLSVMSDSATDGFNSTSAQIVSMSSKRDIWTVKPGDILPIEEKTPGPPRSVSSCIVQTPAMFLLLFLLRLLVI